ncbi:MAG: hypothetical protein ACTSPD_21790, partial [Promethearchaeota archaeon]
MEIKANSRKKIIALFFLIFIILPIFYSIILINNAKITAPIDKEKENKEINGNIPNEIKYPEKSISFSKYEWWNDTWEYRIPVNVSANGAQQNNVPAEVFINFTEYLDDLGLKGTELDGNSIRIVEYTSISDFIEIPSEFHPYTSYNNISSAIGDVVWIVNGTMSASSTRHYFIYFNNNETTHKAPSPNYSTIREWHEGFEEMEKIDGKILSAAGGQDVQPNNYDISKSVAARGNRSLNVWGNCWKAIDLGYTLLVDSNTYVTAKIRIDDPLIRRDISGIAFQQTGRLASLPDQDDTYEIRGWQNWGRATAPPPYGPFDDNYYADSTYFWYTFDLSNEVQHVDFRYIYFVADDDSPDSLNIYWDDLSVWKQPVQTDPDNIPIISVGEIEPVAYSLKITCLDVDGFRVPDAHVYISNDSQPFLNKDDKTDGNGEVFFNNVSRDGTYNITITYTQNEINSPKTKVVFLLKNYNLTELHNELVAKLDLWTINFEISDKDSDPIQNGYILLENNSIIVGKTTLNNNGKGTIRWLSQQSYNYSVYYNYSALTDESNYKKADLLIYQDSIKRADENNPKFITDLRDVDNENPEIITGGATNDVKATIILNAPSGKTISQFNVSAINVSDYILSFEVSIQVDSVWNVIHQFTDSGEQYVNYTYSYSSNNAQAIKITLIKENYQANNGSIEFKYVLSSLAKNQTTISKITFNATDTTKKPFENAIIRIYNTTGFPSLSSNVANLTVNDQGIAQFISLNNETSNWGNYTFEVFFAGQQRFFNVTGDYKSGGSLVNNFNVSLLLKIELALQIELDINDWKTNIELIATNPSDRFNDIFWRDNFSIKFNFSTQYQSNPKNLATPDKITLELLDEDEGLIGNPINLKLYEISPGIFNFTFNTSKYGLKGGFSYKFRITGEKKGYSDPDYLQKDFNVNNILSQLRVYNSTSITEFQSYTITKYWNQTVNITIFYSELNSGKGINSATVKYKWSTYDWVTINPDIAKGQGFYTFTLNTGDVLDVTVYKIDFIATKENFSNGAPSQDFFVNIINRPTLLDGKSDTSTIKSEKIYIKDAVNFTFEYIDLISSKRISNLDVKSYNLQKLDKDGNPIEEEAETGVLMQTSDKRYVLDINTERLEAGNYFIFVSFDKRNFELKNVIITLEVKKRGIDLKIDATNLENDQINVVKGEDIEFEIKLTDPTNGDIPLIGAKVTLVI